MCRHICLLFGKSGDWTQFFYVHALSSSLRIFFATRESGLKNIHTRSHIRRIRVDRSRIRKEKVADKKIFGRVWTRPAGSASKSSNVEKKLVGERYAKGKGFETRRGTRKK